MIHLNISRRGRALLLLTLWPEHDEDEDEDNESDSAISAGASLHGAEVGATFGFQSQRSS